MLYSIRLKTSETRSNSAAAHWNANVLAIFYNGAIDLNLHEFLILAFQFCVVSLRSIHLSEMIKDASRHVIEGFTFSRIKPINFVKTDHDAFLNSIFWIDVVESCVIDNVRGKGKEGSRK